MEKGIISNLLIYSTIAAVLYSVIMLVTRPSLTTFGRLWNYTQTFPDRYFSGINIMTLIPVACILARHAFKNVADLSRNIGRIIVSYMSLLMLVGFNQIFEFDHNDYPGTLTFEQRIINSLNNETITAEGDKLYRIDIDFEGWNMRTPEKYIMASISGEREATNDTTLVLFNLSDENWNRGVSNNGTILLFENSLRNQRMLENAVALSVGEREFAVESLFDASEKYLHVSVACSDLQDLDAFAYPNRIEVVQ